MEDNTQGGQDTLVGGNNSVINLLSGDGDLLIDHASGGDDTLTGGDNSTNNILWGEAQYMYDRAKGGDDRLHVHRMRIPDQSADPFASARKEA